jgi:hypothetical protein
MVKRGATSARKAAAAASPRNKQAPSTSQRQKQQQQKQQQAMALQSGGTIKPDRPPTEYEIRVYKVGVVCGEWVVAGGHLAVFQGVQQLPCRIMQPPCKQTWMLLRRPNTHSPGNFSCNVCTQHMHTPALSPHENTFCVLLAAVVQGHTAWQGVHSSPPWPPPSTSSQHVHSPSLVPTYT